MSNKKLTRIAKQLLDKGETKLAREILTLKKDAIVAIPYDVSFRLLVSGGASLELEDTALIEKWIKERIENDPRLKGVTIYGSPHVEEVFEDFREYSFKQAGTHHWKATIEGIAESDYEYATPKNLSVLATKKAQQDFAEDPNLLAGYLAGYSSNSEVDMSLRKKVVSINSPNIKLTGEEEKEGYKVITTFLITTNEDLTADEVDWLEKFITGQCSDGWGEGFEQYPIKDEDGENWYVSTWHTDSDAVITPMK